MKRFFSEHIDGNIAILKGSERDHCIKVLRTDIGEIVEIVDGSGGLGIGKLLSHDKREVCIALESPITISPKANHPVIAICIPKNPSRWEFFLEKATEIGVSEIIPLISARSEKTRIREERSNQIILSAFKQSLHLYRPVLHSPTSFAEVLTKADKSNAARYIAYCSFDETNTDQNHYLGVLHRESSKTSGPIILIGPEGDFKAEVISLAMENGFKAVSLGPSRLRVETAGIAACNIIQCIDQLD